MALPRDLRDRLTPYLNGQKEGFATTLLSGLMKAYGLEVIDWDGLTIQLQVKEDFGVEMPRRVYDKLMGLVSALNTDEVYKNVAVFDETVNALVGKGLGLEQDIPSTEDVAWAVTELGIVDPEPATRDPKQPWSKNIAKYVRAVLDDDGLNIPPKVLGFAAPRPVPKEGFDDTSFYAGAWTSGQELSDDIDEWATDQARKLVSQLLEIGIEITD